METTTVTEEQIREIARKIGEQPGVVQVWLFGSHATGTAGPDSDVDLLAVYEEEPTSAISAMRHLRSLFRPATIPIDFLVIGRDRFEGCRDRVGTLANMVAHDGRVLYERN